jgi:acyl-CoA synthetase (AMP-forming)/AMP-acid ligase II
VFGVADDRLGEVPIAVVHAQPGCAIDPDELRAFLETRIARFKIPERTFVSAHPLPKLGTGKIDKVAIKALYSH